MARTRVLEATEGRSVNELIEMVGGDIVAQNLKVLAKHGTMWVYGAASGQISRSRSSV
ncbi:MAG: hypothetical protein IPJ30_14580 [Acidobacteria bacterium]|nr:hypothetical protein [Acidobacteriota bacterium]